MKLRRRVYEIVSPAEGRDLPSFVFDSTIITLIFLDIIWFIYASTFRPGETVPLRRMEELILFAFCLEYLVRLWSAGANPRYAGFRGLVRYACTPLAIIDLIAIIPIVAYIPWGPLSEIPAELTALRIFRLFRLGKLLRYFESVGILPRALWQIRHEMGTLAVGVVMALLTASLLMYRVEAESNPEHFGSMPKAMWWSVVTMTTVGYGDAIPQTGGGRIVASILMVCGIALFALPAGLLGAAFTREVTVAVERKRARRDHRERQEQEERLEELEERIEEVVRSKAVVDCPHCGRSFAPDRSPS